MKFALEAMLWLLLVAGLLLSMLLLQSGCGGATPAVIPPAATPGMFRVCLTVQDSNRVRWMCARSWSECQADHAKFVRHGWRIGIEGVSECETIAVVPVQEA